MRLSLAACALLSVAGTAGAASWPPTDIWAVTTLPTRDGGELCVAITRDLPNRTTAYRIALVFGTESRFELMLDADVLGTSDMPSRVPDRLDLRVDDHRVAELPVIGATKVSPNTLLIKADMPGDMMVRQILPHMLRGRRLAVTADRWRYMVPIDSFGVTAEQIHRCAMLLTGSRGPA